MSSIFTIGIAGGSGSGKTYFLKGIADQFNRAQVCIISQDNYYKSREEQPRDENGIQNFDLPTAIDRVQFHKDIMCLKSGKNVTKQEYTFNNPALKPQILEFKAAPILIVEGLFVQYFEEIEKELDLSIFIEAKDHLKLGRRIRRDQIERGYDLDDVLYRYEHHVMPVYETLIQPLKHHADIVIPNNSHFKRAVALLVGYLKAHLRGIDN